MFQEYLSGIHRSPRHFPCAAQLRKRYEADLRDTPLSHALDVLEREAQVSRTATYRVFKTVEERGYVRQVAGYFCSSPLKRASIGLSG